MPAHASRSARIKINGIIADVDRVRLHLEHKPTRGPLHLRRRHYCTHCTSWTPRSHDHPSLCTRCDEWPPGRRIVLAMGPTATLAPWQKALGERIIQAMNEGRRLMILPPTRWGRPDLHEQLMNSLLGLGDTFRDAAHQHAAFHSRYLTMIDDLYGAPSISAIIDQLGVTEADIRTVTSSIRGAEVKLWNGQKHLIPAT